MRACSCGLPAAIPNTSRYSPVDRGLSCDGGCQTAREGTPAANRSRRISTAAGGGNGGGGSCPRCGTRLEHGRVGGRSTVWCPHCQPAP
ncbi:MAG TPA: zinc finger domain-containing protein [Pseudonocardiaceae bacterium]|nr:zinc finger domain-containing protein [Pseudonocardiaceae bacterium]